MPSSRFLFIIIICYYYHQDFPRGDNNISFETPSLEPYSGRRYRRVAVRIAYDDRTVSRVTHERSSADPSSRNTSMSKRLLLNPPHNLKKKVDYRGPPLVGVETTVHFSGSRFGISRMLKFYSANWIYGIYLSHNVEKRETFESPVRFQ